MRICCSRSLQKLQRYSFSTSASALAERQYAWQRRHPTTPTFRKREPSPSTILTSAEEDPASEKPRATRSIPRYGHEPTGTSLSKSDRETDYPQLHAAGSLLAELFPQEVERSIAAVKIVRKIRQVPLRGPVIAQDEPSEHAVPEARKRDDTPAYDLRQCHVLVLKRAGKNLVEEDFRRLVPGDSHLEGWHSSGGLLAKGTHCSRFQLRFVVLT